MEGDNPEFTGFFNNGQKRIDLVLVIASQPTLYFNGASSDTIEEMRIHYLTNIIKFGLELEVDEGKLFEHNNLMFVKVHAPDSIIEEYGLYFNVRKFFKDSHVDCIEPFLFSLGVKHERESIKRLREQYPGPGNYSTLERSRIVYNIINRLPFGFGQHGELLGINRLLKHNIILDVFALHDGPYFLTSDQKALSNGANARQTLFYKWVGIANIWRTQPIHVIQEYLGERVAMYFAFYEYFNFMLLFPAIFGLLITVTHYYGEQPELDIVADLTCKNSHLKKWYICPQCRHFDLCPPRPVDSYCRELKFIRIIDTPYMQIFAFFVSIWGVLFAVIWKRMQNYLMWMWEIEEKYFENVSDPEKVRPLQFYRSRLTGVTLDKFNVAAAFKQGLHVLLSAALFGVWLFGLFVLSTQIWYVKYWLDKIYNKEYPIYWDDTTKRYSEYLFIGIGAGVYSILTTALKVATKILSHKLTALENNETIGWYSCSLALKLYGFYFTGTFALLTLHVFVGNIFYTHLLDMSNWYSISGFKVMNNGLGSSLDDMCITLAVAVVIEQIIAKVPLYLKRKTSDYEGVLNKNAPSWEREYKLKTLKDEYFHNEYNDIAIQFAMATLFSLTFPLAPLLMLLINIWDIRHKARNLLLAYRRPLLCNISGPAIWHNIILLTSYFVPIYNILIIALQSRSFLVHDAFEGVRERLLHRFVQKYVILFNYMTNWDLMTKFVGPFSPSNELKKLSTHGEGCRSLVFDYWYSTENLVFFPEYPTLHVYLFKYQYILLYSTVGVIINLFLCYIFPNQSSDIEEAQYTERRIKQKYYIQKGFFINNESNEPR